VDGQKWQGRSVTVWHVPEAGHQGGFLPHYLDKLVYPGNSANLLVITGIVVCVAKLAFYGSNVDQPALIAEMQRIHLRRSGNGGIFSAASICEPAPCIALSTRFLRLGSL
jgi:hypothetical protein